MNQRIAKTLYLLLQTLRREDVEGILKQLDETQWLSPEQLAEMQWKRFTELLEHAYENVPYYREKFKSEGIEPGDIKTRDDLIRIPILTKADVRNNYTKLLAPNSGRAEEYRTSGSTGEPLRVLRDRSSLGYHRANMYRLRGWYGSKIGSFEATFRLFNYPFWERMKTRVKDAVLNRIRINEHDLRTHDMKKFCQKVIAAKADIFYGFPSLLVRFTRYLIDSGYSASQFSVKVVIATSEMLFPGQKKILEDFYQVPIVNEFGCTETGIIAAECPEGSWHIPVESCLVEVTGNGEIFPESGAGTIVVTDLMNYAMPFIRYEVGDIARCISSGCACGRGLPLIEGVIGRAGRLIELPDGRAVHSFIFNNIFKKADKFSEGSIREFQVRHKPPGEFKCLIVPDSGFTEDTRGFIETSLKDAFGEGCKFEIELCEEIVQEIPGKMEKFIVLDD